MTTRSNTQGKTVKPSQAYEVWYSDDLDWTWYVLKKYQAPEKEATNPYARWYCLVAGYETEYSDVYVSEIKSNARQLTGGVLDAALRRIIKEGY